MIKAALIGAGSRGRDVFGYYAYMFPDELKFVAVAEPVEVRRKGFAEMHNIPHDMTFASWEDILEKEKLCDVIVVATQDKMHFEPTMAALRKGYNVLLEKPMATALKECIEIVQEANKLQKILTVAHVLRYTPFFQKLKEIITSGKIGEVVVLRLHENVGYWHFAHSYVRGNWANTEKSSPIILAKSCHDMDILFWLVGKKPIKISSFGSLKYFNEASAPEGAGERCLACAVEEQCPYSALKLYLGENTSWPTSVIAHDLSMDGRIKALQEGPYGRCVFRSDNDVADHQVVIIDFDKQVNASFILSGFTHDMSRDIRIMGTMGEISGVLEENKIELKMFATQERHVIYPEQFPGPHGGGDYGLLKYFTKQVEDNVIEGLSSADASLMSHAMAFAAEESRLTDKVIDIQDFLNRNK